MAIGLALLLGAMPLAPLAGPRENLFCDAWILHPAAPRFASVRLAVTSDYVPFEMRVAVIDFDEWFEAALSLDPVARKWAGTFQNARFVIRFTAKPVLPMTVTTYADGVPRWRQEVNVPFWPTTMPGEAKDPPGTAITIGRPDDGGTLAGPAELRAIAIDAKGHHVGEARFSLPGTQPLPELATAMANVENGFRDRKCTPPPPLIH